MQAQFNFAGSDEASADKSSRGRRPTSSPPRTPSTWKPPERPGWSTTQKMFATNVPVIVVPADNPGKVKSLADLPTVKRLVIGAPEVPIGNYTRQILEKAKAQLGPGLPRPGPGAGGEP